MTIDYTYYTIEIPHQRPPQVFPWFDEQHALDFYSEAASLSDSYYAFCADNGLEEFSAESVWEFSRSDLSGMLRVPADELHEYLGRYGVTVDVQIRAELEGEETD